MILKKSLFFLTVILISHISRGDIRLHTLFADHMVVQQEIEIKVWGWADPNEEVSIEASWGESRRTVTNEDSTWSVMLKTPEAGGPFQIKFSGKNTIIIRDVLSGEVWLCSGQSNMDFAMSKFVNDARESKYQPLVEYVREEVATAYDPWLRHIEVPQAPSPFEKKKNFEGDWVTVNPAQTGQITAAGYFFARELRKKLDIPIGLIECSLGGTRIQPWVPESAYMQDPDMNAYFVSNRNKIKRIMDSVSVEDFEDVTFKRKFAEWQASDQSKSRPWPMQHPAKDKQVPSTLFNGMLTSVIPYHIKGVIWYQGESNSHFREEEYELYFRTLIESWRSAWGQGDFPFYWTQLANYKVPDHRSDMGWAMVNDHMRRTLDLPNTGMAALHDIGEAKDVHPHNKMDAGVRLALWALSRDYGVDVSVVSGPLYKEIEIKKKKAIISFDYAGSGLIVGKKVLLEKTLPVDEDLKWFEISGKNGVWKPALAKIISDDKIEVSSAEVARPVNVRYGWSSNPVGANLYNNEGLPAAVFTTE